MFRINPDRSAARRLLQALVLALLVGVLMSFQDPFRVAVAAFLLGLNVPLWRHAHRLEPILINRMKFRR